MDSKNEFTVLRVFDTMGEASLTKALLDSAGIDNVLQNDIAASVLTLQNENFGIKLVVRTEDVPRAEAFLSAQISKE